MDRHPLPTHTPPSPHHGLASSLESHTVAAAPWRRAAHTYGSFLSSTSLSPQCHGSSLWRTSTPPHPAADPLMLPHHPLPHLAQLMLSARQIRWICWVSCTTMVKEINRARVLVIFVGFALLNPLRSPSRSRIGSTRWGDQRRGAPYTVIIFVSSQVHPILRPVSLQMRLLFSLNW
jgi:hypothetical protein